uniref:Uncharacterized protein n=1 Tax=Oryctolagus cuniculus TaxID=9986 RepID=A0A5F9DC76_RABIT
MGLGMRAAAILALVGCLATVTESKVYTRCKLAKIFSRAGLDNYEGFSLGNWICMAYYESHYNTTAQTVLEDGSIDYGIFQINSFTWCRRAKTQEKNHCHVACSGTVLVCPKTASLGTKARKLVRGYPPVVSFKLRVRVENSKYVFSRPVNVYQFSQVTCLSEGDFFSY